MVWLWFGCVGLAAQELDLMATSQNPNDVVLTATDPGAVGQPVDFYENGVSVGQIAFDATGTAQWELTSVSAGVHTYYATAAGLTSAEVQVTVTDAVPSGVNDVITTIAGGGTTVPGSTCAAQAESGLGWLKG